MSRVEAAGGARSTQAAAIARVHDGVRWLISIAAFLAPPVMRIALALPFLRSGLTRWDGFLSLSAGTVYLFEEQSLSTCRPLEPRGSRGGLFASGCKRSQRATFWGCPPDAGSPATAFVLVAEGSPASWLQH